MKTSFLPTALLVLGCLSFASAQNKTNVTGLWHNSDFGYQMTIMLNADGSGEFDGEMMRYTVQGNQLKMIIEGMTITYNYSVAGNVLNLSGGDLDAPIAFKRGGAGNEEQSVVSATQPLQQRPPADPPAPTEGNNKLLGVWSGNGESIEFKNNGQCLYLGNTFGYQASDSQITLTARDGSIAFGYSIQGNQLVITGPNGKVTYTKGAANNTAASGAKGVAMELVGKWCWIDVTSTNSGGSSSSRCITLNGDGTYYYEAERSMSVNTNAYYGGTNSQSSDQGTWYVQGDRIYYNSQTSGQGSYRLEKRNHPRNVNDPMIVLDGEAYVTQTYRQPWR